MRERVISLTIGLPRSARDTVGWDTPARCAMTSDVAFSLVRIATSPVCSKTPADGTDFTAAAEPVLLHSSTRFRAACIPIHFRRDAAAATLGHRPVNTSQSDQTGQMRACG